MSPQHNRKYNIAGSVQIRADNAWCGALLNLLANVPVMAGAHTPKVLSPKTTFADLCTMSESGVNIRPKFEHQSNQVIVCKSMVNNTTAHGYRKAQA